MGRVYDIAALLAKELHSGCVQMSSGKFEQRLTALKKKRERET